MEFQVMIIELQFFLYCKVFASLQISQRQAKDKQNFRASFSFTAKQNSTII